MFLKPASEAPHEFVRVCAVMRERPGQWLGGPAAAAARHRASVLVELGLGARTPGAATALLELGTLEATDRVAWLPIRLEFGDGDAVLASFFGSLDAAWLGDRRTYLATSVQYDLSPSTGPLAERALLHRVAEVVAQRFLNDAARDLGGYLSPVWAGG